MKDPLPLICCFVAACTSLLAQNTQFISYPIHSTGYTALFPADPGWADVSISDDLVVYSSEVEYNNDRYGVVLVTLEDHFINSEREVLEALLMSYMDFFKLSNDITSSIGYQMGQRLDSNPSATGILDFWEDETGAQWAVKGWVDHDALAVLYVHSTKPEAMAVPYEFLDGFAFKRNMAAQDIDFPVQQKRKKK